MDTKTQRPTSIYRDLTQPNQVEYYSDPAELGTYVGSRILGTKRTYEDLYLQQLNESTAHEIATSCTSNYSLNLKATLTREVLGPDLKRSGGKYIFKKTSLQKERKDTHRPEIHSNTTGPTLPVQAE